MATEVIMPKVDMVMETGTFVEWLKQEGECVNKGDPLFIISTDKANIEIESPGDGVLAGLKDGIIAIDTGGGLVRFRLEQVERANLKFEW